MSMFSTLKTDTNIADEKDSVGGGFVLDSGLYLATVTLAYGTKSEGGALGLVLQAKTEEGKEIRQTLWMTNKKGENFYEKDGTKNYLPGFMHANSLALLTAGKELSELATETKVVNVYSKEAKADVPTKVEALTDIMGQQILIGLIKQISDKTKKNETSGIYEPTGETREENDIDKFFRARDRMTTAEIRAQATEATFADQWETKWAGQVKNKAKGAGAGGTAGAPKAGAAAGTAKPKQSLFA